MITYKVTTGAGCFASVTRIIGAAAGRPYEGGTTIGGTTNVSVGAIVSLADESTVGTWSSGDIAIATVDETGTVTGIAPGVTNVTHQVRDNNGIVTKNVTAIVVSALHSIVSVIPNPSKGTFNVKGSLGSENDGEVILEVTDVLGQVIYQSKVTAHNGMLNEQVQLNSGLANGMYVLNVRSGNENKVFHIVVER